MFDPGGATTPAAAKTLVGLAGPAGVTVDWAGHVYVTNVGSGSGTTAYFYNPGATAPDLAKTMVGLAAPAGVALDSNYRVYVANYGIGASSTTAAVFDPLILPPGRAGAPSVRSRAHGKALIKWTAADANGEAPTYTLQVSKNRRTWREVTTTTGNRYRGRVRFARPGRILFFRVIARNSLGSGPEAPGWHLRMCPQLLDNT